MNNKLLNYLLESDIFNASEALFAFCGDLTGRDEETIMSANDECGDVADKIQSFIDKYKLENPREGWDKKIKWSKKEKEKGMAR